MIGGCVLRALVFVYYLVPPFWEHLRILVRHSCLLVATYDARGYLVWTLLGIISFFDHCIQSSAATFLQQLPSSTAQALTHTLRVVRTNANFDLGGIISS